MFPVSIRYIAVLGFQPAKKRLATRSLHSVSIRYIAVLGFQPACSESHQQEGRGRFHPLYRGTWFPTSRSLQTLREISKFPSAISRYLVSNRFRTTRPCCWRCVSIRYIAVLGFQQVIVKKDDDPFAVFPSAISRYLVSNKAGDKIDFLRAPVSIRYIAVLGFQLGEGIPLAVAR